MTNVKVFVHATDADTRAMTLAPQTYVPARLKQYAPNDSIWGHKISHLCSESFVSYQLAGGGGGGAPSVPAICLSVCPL